MKASELRIGNYFLLPNGEIGKITYHEIRLLTVAVEKPDYKPIQLTEEILLKCGFSDKDYKKGYIGKDFKSGGVILDFVLSKPHTKGEWNTTYTFDLQSHRFVRIEYLHELQNLYFALTGEELTVNL